MPGWIYRAISVDYVDLLYVGKTVDIRMTRLASHRNNSPWYAEDVVWETEFIMGDLRIAEHMRIWCEKPLHNSQRPWPWFFAAQQELRAYVQWIDAKKREVGRKRSPGAEFWRRQIGLVAPQLKEWVRTCERMVADSERSRGPAERVS
jgi:hypothetical protein